MIEASLKSEAASAALLGFSGEEGAGRKRYPRCGVATGGRRLVGLGPGLGPGEVWQSKVNPKTCIKIKPGHFNRLKKKEKTLFIL